MAAQQFVHHHIIDPCLFDMDRSIMDGLDLQDLAQDIGVQGEYSNLDRISGCGRGVKRLGDFSGRR